MTITLPDEAVEAGAKAYHNRSVHFPWEELDERDQAADKEHMRAALTAALEQMVESGRASKSQLTLQDDSFLALIIRLDGDK